MKNEVLFETTVPQALVELMRKWVNLNSFGCYSPLRLSPRAEKLLKKYHNTHRETVRKSLQYEIQKEFELLRLADEIAVYLRDVRFDEELIDCGKYAVRLIKGPDRISGGGIVQIIPGNDGKVYGVTDNISDRYLQPIATGGVDLVNLPENCYYSDPYLAVVKKVFDNGGITLPEHAKH